MGADLRVFRELWQPAVPHLVEAETSHLAFDNPQAWLHLGEGWQTRDSIVFAQVKHVWATHLHADLHVTVLHPRDLVLSLVLMANALESLPEQKVEVVWEGRPLGTCTFDKAQPWRWEVFRAEVPKSIQKPGRNTIALVSRYAVSRKDVNEGDETREAAVAISVLSLTEPGRHAEAPTPPVLPRFDKSSLLQPARTRLRFPMHLPSASACSLQFEGTASAALGLGATVWLRCDGVAGPKEKTLYSPAKAPSDQRVPTAVDLTPWAGRLVEVVFDTSASPAGSTVEWVRPQLVASSATPRDEETPPSAPAPEFPPVSNVVLVVLDALRADALGCYGNPRGCSPALDSLAANGLLFDRHCAAATETFGSTASLLTSLHPFQHGVINHTNRLADESLLLQRRLSANGVLTGCVSQNPFVSPGNVLGRHFDGIREVFGPDLVTCQQVTKAALEVASQAGDHPLFLYVHYLPPHAPYDMAQRFRQTLSADPVEAVGLAPADMRLARKGLVRLDGHGVEQLQTRYLENARFADSLLADLVAGLRERGFGAETALIVTSDHGESQGQHDWFGHEGIPYQTQAHIPLVMNTLAPEGLGSTLRYPDVTRTVDLYPTVCALLATPLGEAPVEGVNLLGPRAHDDQVLAFSHGLRESVYEAFLFQRYKLLVSRTRSWLEVYDLVRDPRETTNLAGTCPVLTNHLLAVADAWRAARRAAFTLVGQGAASGAPQAAPEPAHLKELGALGYL